MRELVIDGRRIADDTPCYVVAELGNTHNGSLDIAKQLIDACAKAGVDAVKFQKKTIEQLYTLALLSKPYDSEVSFGATYGKHKQALELNADEITICAEEASAGDVSCFATGFDEHAIDDLMRVGVPCLKIHSGGLTDPPLLRHAARQGVPLILSTGAATCDDIDKALDVIGNVPHAILHCTASYPVASDELNLRVILTLRERYPETVIGFSSHATGIWPSLVAYAFGARIIEHHVTLSRAMKGTDHGFSLEPKGLATLVEDLTSLRLALGDGVKRIYRSEWSAIGKLRRQATEDGWRIAG